jgi:hypothetical protein
MHYPVHLHIFRNQFPSGANHPRHHWIQGSSDVCLANTMAARFGCDPRVIGGSGYVNCGKSLLGTVEEKGRSISRVSVIFI